MVAFRRHVSDKGVTAVAVVLTLLACVPLLSLEARHGSSELASWRPQFSHPAGFYAESFALQLDGPPNAQIFYTLDGSIPDAEATRYTRPIPLLGTAAEPSVTAIRARTRNTDGDWSETVSAAYFVGARPHLPLLSIVIAPEDFSGRERGIYANHWFRGREWERPVDFAYLDPQTQASFQIGAGLRIHGGATRYLTNKKSFRLYFRRAYGAGELEYPLFGAEPPVAFDQLVVHNAGTDDLILFKNQLVERLAAEMGIYATRSRPVLLFINGRSFGIYQLRERINKQFLEDKYGVAAADLSDTPNNYGMQSEEQRAVDIVHWEHFIAFVEAHDLTKPANYAYVQSQIDVENFIDYYLLQMYIANLDWPHHNVHQFRPRTQGGRWQWLVWDNDFAFGIPNRDMVSHVLTETHPLSERPVMLLTKLLANDGFRGRFLRRADELFATTLSSRNVHRHVDELAAEIGPDVHYETERWAVTHTSWEAMLAELHAFVEQRPEIMSRHLREVLGPYE